MNTKQIYYEQPYASELDATVLSVDTKSANAQVQLSATVFYPQGGGQPADVGEICGPNGKLRVEMVLFKEGGVIHMGKLLGSLSPGEAVHMQLKWSHRHHGMRLHTAGHTLHEAMLSLTDKLVPVKANHGSNAYLEYAGEFPTGISAELETRVNNLVMRDLPVFMRESSFDEIKSKCRFVPAGLPTHKPLRTVQIGDGELVPCGGVHVRSLGEIGRVVIGDTKPDPKTGHTVVKYRIGKMEESKPVAALPNEEVCLGSPS